ncbi:peroxisomal biogenesis factor 11 [Auriculariales sp. MPI-PUGE-AT-0066]|nr:peroxisomal biogenesis factor 11 [Auriculariales sp. MPI-PUGE-AT-0066]
MNTAIAATHNVVLHPHATRSLKVLSTTLGRDKLYRAVQYFARFFAWVLLQQGDKLEAARWNALKGHLASARKLLRLFKPVEHLQLAIKGSQSSLIRTSPAEQYLAVLRQLAYAGYLSFDALVWANSIRFLNFPADKATKYLKTSLRFWLAGILFSLGSSILKTRRIEAESRAIRAAARAPVGEKDISKEAEITTRVKVLRADRTAVRTQMVIDSLDVFLPASGLGLVNINDGAAGVFGLVTSLLALRASWAQAGPSV